MDQTLRQIGELLLGAVPTALLLLALYAVYHLVLHRPLEQILAKRRSMSEGALEQARADIAAAEAKAAEYEERLREAKVAIFKAQEQRRKQVQEARAQAVASARAKADEQVKAARQGIDADIAAAKQTLQADSDRLASDIIRAILQTAGTQAPVAGSQ